jgi:putative phosphoesterase
MKIIGVISDTHGLLRPEALEVLAGVDLIVHAGDIGPPAVIDSLQQIAPVHAVRGNVDRAFRLADWPSHTEIVEAENQLLYVLHDLHALDLDPVAAGFRVVISGHTHNPKVDEKRGVVYLNPGSAGPRRLQLPISLARMTIGTDGEEEDVATSWPKRTYTFGDGPSRIVIEMISLDERGW